MSAAHTFRFVLITALILLSPHVSASNAYLCVAEQVAGFIFDKGDGEWKGGHSTINSKYLVSKSTDEGTAWVVKKFGDKSASYWCDEESDNSILYCKGFFMEVFIMNSKNLRFMTTYLGLYREIR